MRLGLWNLGHVPPLSWGAVPGSPDPADQPGADGLSAATVNVYCQQQLRRDILGGPVVRPQSSNAGGESLIPHWGTKITHAIECSLKTLKIKKKTKRTIRGDLHHMARVWNAVHVS